MVNQQYIDDIALQIANQTDILQQELVRDLRKLSKDRRFQSIDEFLFAIDQLDIQELVLFKSKNIITGYEVAHTQILIDMDLIADITEQTLRGLTHFSTSSFTDHLGTMGSILKKEIVKGTISGATDVGILQAIQQQAGLSNFQMQTLVRTGLNDYSRSVGKEMAEQMRANQKFRYVGAIDDRTRPICLEMWGAGTLTLKQIKKTYPARFVEGGGFNCRHQWTPVELETKSKDFRKDAPKER
jgi:hypothetical protein